MTSHSALLGMIGAIGAAGGQINCLATGEIVITLSAGAAPAVPQPIQIIFHGLAVSQMASAFPDERSRRRVLETALRLARHALDELIASASIDSNQVVPRSAAPISWRMRRTGCPGRAAPPSPTPRWVTDFVFLLDSPHAMCHPERSNRDQRYGHH